MANSNNNIACIGQEDLQMAVQAQKRRLTLVIPNQLQSSLTKNNEHGDSGVTPCKSPKIYTPGQTRMWNPVICTVCMEDLFSFSQQASFLNPGNSHETGKVVQEQKQETVRHTVSTRCGHLFHTECINMWFMENKEKEIKECPFCKKEMMANDTTRIFPIFGDD